MTSEDKRSPLARARDEWLAGEECRMLMDLTCGDLVTQDSKYIRNRFERAFLAGAAAQEKIDLENSVISIGQLVSFKKCGVLLKHEATYGVDPAQGWDGEIQSKALSLNINQNEPDGSLFEPLLRASGFQSTEGSPVVHTCAPRQLPDSYWRDAIILNAEEAWQSAESGDVSGAHELLVRVTMLAMCAIETLHDPQDGA